MKRNELPSTRDASPDTDVTPVDHEKNRTRDPVYRVAEGHAGCDRCRSNPTRGFIPGNKFWIGEEYCTGAIKICDCLVLARLRALRTALDLPDFAGRYRQRTALVRRTDQRLIIRGGEWSLVSEYVSAAVLFAAHCPLTSTSSVFPYPKVVLSDLYDVLQKSSLLGNAGMDPSDLLVIRVNKGHAKHAGNAPALAETMHRCRRQGVWLIDEPRERFGPGDPKTKTPPHRAWSEDVAQLVDELGYIEIKDLDPRPALDINTLPRLPPRAPAKPVDYPRVAPIATPVAARNTEPSSHLQPGAEDFENFNPLEGV